MLRSLALLLPLVVCISALGQQPSNPQHPTDKADLESAGHATDLVPGRQNTDQTPANTAHAEQDLTKEFRCKEGFTVLLPADWNLIAEQPGAEIPDKAKDVTNRSASFPKHTYFFGVGEAGRAPIMTMIVVRTGHIPEEKLPEHVAAFRQGVHVSAGVAQGELARSADEPTYDAVNHVAWMRVSVQGSAGPALKALAAMRFTEDAMASMFFVDSPDRYDKNVDLFHKMVREMRVDRPYKTKESKNAASPSGMLYLGLAITVVVVVLIVVWRLCKRPANKSAAEHKREGSQEPPTTSPEDPSVSMPARRPPWVGLLAIVLLILGVVYALATAFYVPRVLSEEVVESYGWHVAGLLAICGVIATNCLASGVGMFMGRNWARRLFFWGLPAIMLAYIIVFPYSTPEETGRLSQDTCWGLIFYICGRIILSRPSARTYFKVSRKAAVKR